MLLGARSAENSGCVAERPKYSIENQGGAVLFAEPSADHRGRRRCCGRIIQLKTKALRCFSPSRQRIIAGVGDAAVEVFN